MFEIFSIETKENEVLTVCADPIPQEKLRQEVVDLMSYRKSALHFEISDGSLLPYRIIKSYEIEFKDYQFIKSISRDF